MFWMKVLNGRYGVAGDNNLFKIPIRLCLKSRSISLSAERWIYCFE